MTGCPLLDSEYAARQNGKRLPCERLAEENDKLLMRVNAEHIVRQNLAVENAKLRELVRDMHKWLWNGADCTECPFVAKCDLNAAFESDIHAHVCLGWSEIHRRMRELGVEVDG